MITEFGPDDVAWFSRFDGEGHGVEFRWHEAARSLANVTAGGRGGILGVVLGDRFKWFSRGQRLAGLFNFFAGRPFLVFRGVLGDLAYNFV